MTNGPCLCGATDCPSCGVAQGYRVVRQPRPGGGWHWVNPEGTDEEEDDYPIDDEAELDPYQDRA
jgi:hypothetical protein